MRPEDRQRVESWLMSIEERHDTNATPTDGLIAAHYVPIMLKALDARDDLLREAADFLGSAYMDDRRHREEFALEAKIRAILGETP